MPTCVVVGQQEPSKPKRRFPWHACWKIFFFGAGVATASWFIHAERCRTAKYAAMEKERDAALKSAADSKTQLELTLDGGDCGTLLWSLDPDLGPSQLRLIQTPAMMKR